MLPPKYTKRFANYKPISAKSFPPHYAWRAVLPARAGTLAAPMSYDLYLFSLAPGQSAQNRFEQLTIDDGDDFPDPGPINPAAEKQKRDLAAAITALNPQMLPFKFDYAEVAKYIGKNLDDARRLFRHIELNDESANSRGIQVTIYDDHATITVPYWHKTPKAATVFKEIASFGRALSKAYPVTYDPQLDRPISWDADTAAVLAAYSRIADNMDKVMAKAAKSLDASPKKPWWKFW